MIVTSNIVNDLNTAFQLINLGTNEKIKQGEALLMQMRGDIQYPKVLFDYLQTYEISLGLRAAIELKLWFKEYKNFDDYQVAYLGQVVQVIKQNIVSAYMTSNAPLIHQLKDAIVFLAQRDFPTHWPQLIAELNACLLHPEYIHKALKLIFKLTEKYTYQARSDPLYEEIIITCDTVHNNLLLLAQSILQQISNGQNLQLSYEILKVLLKVFYNLNFQDLHPSFEDNLKSWMEFMKLVLRLQPVQGLEQYLFKCKGEALKCVLLYATKYRDDFGELIQVFSSEIWTVCTQTNTGRDSDKIVLSALKYFKNLIAWRDMQAFFQQNIKVLIESLIIKNLQFSKEESGIFQDEPQEFIEKFFEQSDLESRRAQAVELFKTVTKYFTSEVNAIIQEYVSSYVQSGMNNPDNEIILINLIIDGSAKSFTSRDGVSEIALSSEIVLGFYNHCIKPKLGQIFELQQANQPVESKFTPVSLAFYCRFLFYFRNVIDKGEIPTLAQLISRLQLTKRTTLSHIACFTALGLINVRNDVRNYSDLSLYFETVPIQQYLQVILTDVYSNILSQSKLESYSLKLMNAVIFLLKSEIFNALTAICDLLQDLLKKIKMEYEFLNTHLVFEIIANVIDNCTQAKNQAAANQLQQSILNLLDELLRENKGDVTNFVLQIYGLFLQIQSNANTYYKNLLTNLLEIHNWDESNSSLFSAYIIFFKYSFSIGEIQTPQLQAILNNIVKHSPQQYTELAKLLISLNQQWMGVVLGIIFEQYQRQLHNEPQQSSKSKATHLTQRLIDKEILLLLSHIHSTYDIQVLVQECAKISPQLLESFLVNELNIIKSISQRNERRIIFLMLTAILFETQTLTQNWSFVFQAMVENMVLKKRNPIKFFGRVQDVISSSSGFQPLKPIAQINTPKQLVDEDKLFCKKFKEYYSNPVVQQQLAIAQLLTKQQQECLSHMIQQE